MGISLGSSKRDHAVTVSLLGQECRVERIRMDGDMKRMIETIKAGRKVDAFGLGGISVNLYRRPALSACAADHGGGSG